MGLEMQPTEGGNFPLDNPLAQQYFFYCIVVIPLVVGKLINITPSLLEENMNWISQKVPI